MPLRPEQQYSEYTNQYINWNGLLEELKACINAVGGASVTNSTQYEDSWRGVQLALSQLRSQLLTFSAQVSTNIGAAQALLSQKGQPNGLASLGSDGILTSAQRFTPPFPTPAQVGAISVGEKGIANGVATLGADQKVPLLQLPPFETQGAATAAIASHVAALDPHSQYATDTDLTTHTGNTTNPHSTTAAQVGAIPTTEKGAASGVAVLDTDAKLLAAQVRNPTTAGWINATLVNGWTNFGSGFADAQYRLWSDGLVEIRGFIKNTVAPATGSTIFTLPVGHRPSVQKVFPADANNLFASVGVLSTGEVVYYSGSVTVWFSLDLPPFKV